MIGDLLMDNEGKISAFDSTEVTYTLMGRFGNTMLVNGSTNYELQAVAGEVDRYYVTNVASARPFKLVIPGAKLKLVGSDGGAFERETFVDSVTISPSERAVLDVWYEKPGTYKLQNQTPAKTYDLATIVVTSGSPQTSYVNQFKRLGTNTTVVNSISPFRSAIAKPADKSLALSLTMNSGSSMGGMDMGSDMIGMDMGGMSMPADTDTIEWEDAMPGMNKPSTSKSLTWKLIDQQTNAFNDKINWQFKRGQQVKITLYNDPNSAHPMQHPIHVHGQRFLVTSVNGKPTDNLAWKDTVMVGKGETVEVLVDMSNPGTWLIHCHIPEHMESGMQSKYTVQ
jgi:FtsP/CotA-like multicopper oxidase with cupredoxin domain